MARPTTSPLLPWAGAAFWPAPALLGWVPWPGWRCRRRPRRPRAQRHFPVLSPGDDWAATLAMTPQVQLVAGAAYTLDAHGGSAQQHLDRGQRRHHYRGNRVHRPPSLATSKVGITIRGLTLQGRTADPINQPANFAHTAIRLIRCTSFRITDCDFNFWLGAGVVVTGSTSDDYFSYRGHIQGNNFVKLLLWRLLRRPRRVLLADREHFHGQPPGHLEQLRQPDCHLQRCGQLLRRLLRVRQDQPVRRPDLRQLEPWRGLRQHLQPQQRQWWPALDLQCRIPHRRHQHGPRIRCGGGWPVAAHVLPATPCGTPTSRPTTTAPTSGC